MARLGFDLLDHLEAMRSKGVRNIEMDQCIQASSASLRTWEDSNYPYRRETIHFGNKHAPTWHRRRYVPGIKITQYQYIFKRHIFHATATQDSRRTCTWLSMQRARHRFRRAGHNQYLTLPFPGKKSTYFAEVLATAVLLEDSQDNDEKWIQKKKLEFALHFFCHVASSDY